MGAPDSESYVKTEFLKRIAHELRGPSGVTLGALNELSLALGAESERVADLFAMARRSVQRVLRTADRLQHIAQLEAGEVEWHYERRDLRDIVRSAVVTVEGLEARKGISIVAALPETVCAAEVDVDWVTLAVTELILNAIRNAKTKAEVSVARSEKEVRVSVSDDGLGFAGPINERFSPSSRRQGLGVSLSLVNDVAKAHGGQFVIEPPEGEARGAKVYLSFPLGARAE